MEYPRVCNNVITDDVLQPTLSRRVIGISVEPLSWLKTNCNSCCNSASDNETTVLEPRVRSIRVDIQRVIINVVFII